MKTSRKLRWGTAGLVFGMVLLGSGIARASVPDGNTVHTCRKNSGGALRVIDTGAGQKCQTGETALDLSQWKFRGAWSSANAYKKGDVTTSGGSSFIATADIPVGGADSWAVIAQGGKPGPAGPQGPAGPAGPAGPSGKPKAYEARCGDCKFDTAWDANTFVKVISVSFPPGMYYVTAHVAIFNRQVVDSENAGCYLNNGPNDTRDAAFVDIDAAGFGGHDQDAELVTSDVSNYTTGKATLYCYADDNWHFWNASIQAIAVS